MQQYQLSCSDNGNVPKKNPPIDTLPARYTMQNEVHEYFITLMLLLDLSGLLLLPGGVVGYDEKRPSEITGTAIPASTRFAQ